MRRSAWLGSVMVLAAVMLQVGLSPAWSGRKGEPLPEELPVKGKVTLLDFGANTCIPCIMLAPIMEELKRTYADKAAIHFVNVRKHRRLARRFRIRTIPTLIFFDREGNEVSRYEGFLDKYFIEKKLKGLGVE